MIPLPVFWLIDKILEIYSVVVIAMVIMSWLVGFNVINRHNGIVDAIWRTLIALTEPVLRPIRSALPPFGGLDLSPLVLLLGIWFLRMMNGWLSLRIGV